MKTALSHIMLLALLLLSRDATSQDYKEKGIYIIGHEITFRNDSAQFNLTIQVNELNIHIDQALELEFCIEKDGRQQPLPIVSYEGSQYSRVDNRNYLLSYEYVAPPYHIYKNAQKNSSYTLKYKAGVPYASWMNHASLVLRQTLKDCCNEHQLHEKTLVADINLKKHIGVEVKKNYTTDSLEIATLKKKNNNAALINSMILLIEPEETKSVVAKPDKTTQHREFVATISHYKEGYAIPYQYKNNGKALFKIDSLLRSIENKPLIKITRIEITGYTSPEGTYQYNKELAQKRVLELKSYLLRNYRISGCPIRTSSVGEDWDGLTKLINETHVPYKNEVLSIIQNIGIFRGREKALMDLADGDPYKFMLANLFPKLRRVEVKILYTATADNFSNNQRQTTAQLTNDVVAYNNAAAAAIAIGDIKKSRIYLEKIKNDPRSYINWGVLYYIEGNTAMAEEYFRKAVKIVDTKEKAQANIRLITEYTDK